MIAESAQPAAPAQLVDATPAAPAQEPKPSPPAKAPRKSQAPKRAPSSGQQALPGAVGALPRPAEFQSAADRFIPENTHQVLGSGTLADYLAASGEALALEVFKEVRSLDFTTVLPENQTRGRKRFHPRVLLGLVFYGCLRRQTSLRELERLARIDLGAWHICGGLQPDHSTIGDFLNDNAEAVIDEFFVSVTRQLVRSHHIGPGRVAIDGTIVEAAASGYRTIKAEAARERAKLAHAAAAAAPEDPKVQKRAEAAQDVATIASFRETDRQEKKGTGDKLQVATSEPDAVIQPRKEGGIAPGYKPSVLAHESGFIMGQATDPSSEQVVIDHLLRQAEEIAGAPPAQALLDAGYCDEATLQKFVDRGIDVLCPAGRESSPDMQKQSDKKLLKSSFQYLPEQDVYRCPQGVLLSYKSYETDADGRKVRHFQVLDQTVCASCPLRSRCSEAKDGRTIKRYPGDELKEAMQSILRHPQAKLDYSRRKAIVEPVHSRMKERQGLRRFKRRGLRAVSLEYAFHCIAHNIGLSARLRLKAAAAARPAGPGAPRRVVRARFRLSWRPRRQVTERWMRGLSLPRARFVGTILPCS